MSHPIEGAGFEIGFDLELGSKAQDPIDVRVVGTTVEKTEEQPADYISWNTYPTGGVVVPLQILPQAPKRHRATISVGPGLAAANVTGWIMVGTQGETNNPSARSGAIYHAGQSIVIEASSAVWLIGDGTNDLTVTVTDERYK